MANIKTMEQELLELREGTLKEFSEVESTEMDSQKLEEWNNRNEKMSELVEKIKEAKKYEAEKADMESEVEKGKAVEPNAIHAEVKEAPTTLGQELLESKAYQAFMKDGQKNISSELKFNPAYEFKTTLTETGYPPAVTRSDLVVPTAVRDPQNVLDLIDTITTDNFQYKYLEETTFTNNTNHVITESDWDNVPTVDAGTVVGISITPDNTNITVSETDFAITSVWRTEVRV